MLQEERLREAREAEENLRVIRGLMERSTKFSTFSGVSGILAGLASIGGCLATRALEQKHLFEAEMRISFLMTWAIVVVFAVTSDYFITKRRAAQVGKHVLSRLGKQMFVAASPGLGSGALLTLFFIKHGLLPYVYPVWMLSYGIAVCAVGLFSQREVSYLGGAFLLAGTFALLLPVSAGLPLMAVSFGGFHILYGVLISRKDGW